MYFLVDNFYSILIIFNIMFLHSFYLQKGIIPPKMYMLSIYFMLQILNLPYSAIKYIQYYYKKSIKIFFYYRFVISLSKKKSIYYR